MNKIETSTPKEKMQQHELLALLGLISVEAGVVCIYWPAALILFGVLCFLAAASAELKKDKK